MTDTSSTDPVGAPQTPALAQHVEAIAAEAARTESEAVAIVAAAPASIPAEIEAWFVEQIHNSPVARAGAEIFNHVRAAVDDLKSRLAAL